MRRICARSDGQADLANCTQCGGSRLFEDDGFVVCAYCRSRFKSQVDELANRTTIGVFSDIQMLLQKCRDDPANRRRYASLILDIDPTNHEATTYLR